MQAHSLPPPALREELKATAIEAVKLAGAILEDFVRKGFNISLKDTINLVTDADRRSEDAIVDFIGTRFPSHQVLAEEAGIRGGTDATFRWVIDPLDGTTNFAHGYPVYCISIGIEYQGTPFLGVVLDPTRQELFVAETGEGAFLNGQRLRASRTTSLNQALLVTGFAYDIRETPDNNLNHFASFALRAQGMRRTGSAALDMCYVAAGRFDGFWEVTLHPWDMAAGAVIVQEAGGRLSNFKGAQLSIYGKELVATNGLIHDQILTVLNGP